MPIGAPGLEQFRNMVTEIRNGHIIFAMGPLVDLRMEVTGQDNFKVRGGLDTTAQDHYIRHLQNADARRRVITYAPNREELDARIKNGIDTTKVIGRGSTLGGAPADVPMSMDVKPFGGDEVQAAPGGMLQIPWAFDGTDQNIPVNSKLSFRSNEGLLLVQSIDATLVAWTRLESRFETRFITVGDSMRQFAFYQQILEYLLLFAGDKNRIDFAVGVRPTEEPRGAANAPNMITEDAGVSGIVPTVG